MRYLLLVLILLIPVSAQDAQIQVGNIYEVTLNIQNSASSNEQNVENYPSIRDKFTMEVVQINTTTVIVEKMVNEDLGIEFPYNFVSMEDINNTIVGYVDMEASLLNVSIIGNISQYHPIWMDPFDMTVIFGNETSNLSFFIYNENLRVFNLYDIFGSKEVYIFERDNSINIQVDRNYREYNDQYNYVVWSRLNMEINQEENLITLFEFIKSSYFDINGTYIEYTTSISFEVDNRVANANFPIFPLFVAIPLLLKRRNRILNI